MAGGDNRAGSFLGRTLAVAERADRGPFDHGLVDFADSKLVDEPLVAESVAKNESLRR